MPLIKTLLRIFRERMVKEADEYQIMWLQDNETEVNGSSEKKRRFE